MFTNGLLTKFIDCLKNTLPISPPLSLATPQNLTISTCTKPVWTCSQTTSRIFGCVSPTVKQRCISISNISNDILLLRRNNQTKIHEGREQDCWNFLPLYVWRCVSVRLWTCARTCEHELCKCRRAAFFSSLCPKACFYMEGLQSFRKYLLCRNSIQCWASET